MIRTATVVCRRAVREPPVLSIREKINHSCCTVDLHSDRLASFIHTGPVLPAQIYFYPILSTFNVSHPISSLPIKQAGAAHLKAHSSQQGPSDMLSSLHLLSAFSALPAERQRENILCANRASLYHAIISYPQSLIPLTRSVVCRPHDHTLRCRSQNQLRRSMWILERAREAKIRPMCFRGAKANLLQLATQYNKKKKSWCTQWSGGHRGSRACPRNNGG